MLRFLKNQLRLLSESDIIKLALSEFYAKRQNQSHEEWLAGLPVRQATPEEEEDIGQALGEYKRGEFVEVDMDNDDEVKEFFDV